ncbi:MAG TPA: succinate dehydrogenase, hydrophobic membrane anchor protein [Caulobacteraceae bacterium]|nr:succinate dehydrogenase, hydrophobic membrane anchor protein [Caulobacteraceae bacterium]
MSDDFRTDRKKIEGAGGAHHGAGVWVRERVSSVVLLVLGIWGLWAATRFLGQGFDGAAAWLRSPLNAILLTILMLTTLYHMQLGLRVVIEDYVHKPVGKSTLLFINFFLCVVLAVVAVFAVLKVALGGGLRL